MIIEHVTRDRHHRDLQHPLRYADLEALLPRQEAPDRVYLAAHFTGAPLDDVPEHRQSRRPGRTRADLPGSAAYHQVMRLHHHPEAARVVDPAGRPWAGDASPRVVFADVHPLDRKVAEWFPGLRAAVGEVLGPRVRALFAAGPASRWLLHVALLPESTELEIGTTRWTALLRHDEDIERIALP